VDKVDAIVGALEGPPQLSLIDEIFKMELKRAERLVGIDSIRFPPGKVVDGRGLPLIEVSAVSVRPSVAQQKRGQAPVKVAIFADLLPLVEDRPRNPFDRALPRAGLDHGHRAIEGRIEGGAEVLCPWVIVKIVGRLAAHADGTTRVGDAAAGRERLEELLLPFHGPAVATNAAGGEVGRWFWW